MAVKDFDFKRFLLQRGEQVGLGVAVGLAAILLLWGGKGFFAGTPQGTASDIEEKSKKAAVAIDTSEPTPDIQVVSPKLLANLDVHQIDPYLFRLHSPFVVPSPRDDTKRRNPEVLAARDFDVKMIRAAFPLFLLDKDEKSIWVVKGEGINENLQRGALRNRMGLGAGIGSGMGAPGGGSDDSATGPGIGDMPGSGPGDYAPAQSSSLFKRTAQPIEIDKIANNPNTKFVEQIYPHHVAVVSAAFPYKQQLERFRRALLGPGTMNDLYRHIAQGQIAFQFAGADIQRRVTLPSGKIKDFSEKDQGWKDFNNDFQRSYVWLFRRAPRFEPEDPKLRDYGLVQEGLVMPRPVLARGGKYPSKETELPSIKKAIEDLDKAIADKRRPVQTAPSRFTQDPKKINPFSTNPFGAGDAPKDQMPSPASDTATPSPIKPADPGVDLTKPQQQEEPLIPEHVLVRFLDITVLPGHSYEYRVRIKMRNPNYGKKDVVSHDKLAKQEFLVSAEWSGTEGKPARVPESLYYYAVDEKPDAYQWRVLMGDRDAATKEKTPIQVHRWLPTLPGQKEQPVANWILAERLLVHRGEYVGREEKVEVPIWDYAQETDLLAQSRKLRGEQRVPVPFQVRSQTEGRAAILVDFEGGRVGGQKIGERQVPADDAATQLLIQAPDGRLIARNSQDDTNDEVRKEVHSTWRQWVNDARLGRKTSGTKLFDDKLPRGGNTGKPPGGGQ